ncbi:MAG: thiamine pyrophosphate-dependent enzyme [Candidatus Aenigmatarchaeota archaeon]
MLIKSIREVPEEHLVTGGHGLCAGCGPSIGLKLALAVLGKNTFVINSAGCFTLQPTYPYTPFKVPWIHLAIENGGAAAVGICSALKALKKKATVLAYIGDGATYDIGLQSLSNALEHGHDFIYICYDNQNFANTGHQMDSATPKLTWTETTPKGNPFWRKPINKIVAAHGIPYVATASVGFPVDYINKLEKAKRIRGPKFINLLSPCQPGWKVDPSLTVEAGKLAVECGAWPLYEIEDGKFRLTYKPEKLKPVKEYLKIQGRYRHLKEKDIRKIQEWVNEEWRQLSAGNFWEAREY